MSCRDVRLIWNLFVFVFTSKEIHLVFSFLTRFWLIMIWNWKTDTCPDYLQNHALFLSFTLKRFGLLSIFPFSRKCATSVFYCLMIDLTENNCSRRILKLFGSGINLQFCYLTKLATGTARSLETSSMWCLVDTVCKLTQWFNIAQASL